MNPSANRKICWALASVVLCVFLSINAFAQVNFIQITDPHIFDGKDDTAENESAFCSIIGQIDSLAEQKSYEFVVVTGDLGLEKLIDGDGKLDTKIEEKANALADMISSSRIKKWLFVPGNNDLYDELPYTIDVFRDFIKVLDQKLEDKAGKPPKNERVNAIDLCPVGNDLETGVYPSSSERASSPYIFIGFNNASFKNNGSVKRAEKYYKLQSDYIDEVLYRLENIPGKHAYIFYHIPEIDDPQWVKLEKENPADAKLTKRKEEIASKKKEMRGDKTKKPRFDKASVFSAWLVSDEVRDLWGKVITNNDVKGLFAGHFHNSERKTYHDFNKWMLTGKLNEPYENDSTSKLIVSPPIAVKFQAGGEQARGFREISIDEKGEVTNKSSFVWYEINRTFSTGLPSQSTIEEPPPSPPTEPEDNLLWWIWLMLFLMMSLIGAVIWMMYKYHKQIQNQLMDLITYLQKKERKVQKNRGQRTLSRLTKTRRKK